VAMARWRRGALAAGVAGAVFGLGWLTGIATERLQFDARRTEVVQRYEQLSAARRAQLIEHERAAARSGATTRRTP
jgi:hypothetical protein